MRAPSNCQPTGATMIEIPSHGTVYPQIGRGHPSKGHKKPVLTHQLSGGRRSERCNRELMGCWCGSCGSGCREKRLRVRRSLGDRRRRTRIPAATVKTLAGPDQPRHSWLAYLRGLSACASGDRAGPFNDPDEGGGQWSTCPSPLPQAVVTRLWRDRGCVRCQIRACRCFPQ